MMPLNQVASLSIPGPLIVAFDPSSWAPSRAVQRATWIEPASDGKVPEFRFRR
jgi:hypothetical protein